MRRPDPGYVSVSLTFDELDVSEATVYRWIAQDEVDLGERAGVRSGERAELSGGASAYQGTGSRAVLATP